MAQTADITRTIHYQNRVPFVLRSLNKFGLADGGKLTIAGRIVLELIR